MLRWGTIGLRLVIVAFLLVVTAFGSMWAYVGYEAHRATVMLREVSQVHVGDSETSTLPLVQRYGGFKEEWIDKDEYEYQQKRLSDYKYEIEISPFETAVHRTSRLTQAFRAVRAAVPAHLRPALGMRDWGTVAVLSVRGGRIQSVSAMTLVESRRARWVGHRWELAEGMPRHDMHQRFYAVGAAFLTMPGGGEMMIENYFTPNSSEEEASTARQFSIGCLTSIKGCDGLCDVAPHSVEYVKQHPDVAWNIIPPKCP